MARQGKVSREELFNELKLKCRNELRKSKEPKKFAEDVRDWWANHEAPSPWNPSPLTKTGPYATGRYAESIKVRQTRNLRGLFTRGFEVYTLSPIANLLEHGTGIDKPDSKSPWGRFTRTPEFAPAAKTAHHFGGTQP